MLIHNHSVDSEVFASLAAGGGGEAACIQLVAAERSKHMLALRYIVEMANSIGHPRARDVTSAYETLADIHRICSQGVECVLRNPAVGAWAVKTARNLSLRQVREAAPERLALIAASAAMRADFPYRTVTLVTQGEVVIPSLGRAVFGDWANGQKAVIEVTGGGLVISIPETRITIANNPSVRNSYWHGMRSLKAEFEGKTFQLAIDDFDPFRFDAISNLGACLTPTEVRNWDADLQSAWRLLVQQHQRVASEVKTILVTLVPLKSPHLFMGSSATSRDAFGTIALSRPTGSLSFALTLAHEVQHAKLAGLLDLVDLVRPSSSSSHYAPWRDDPRPTSALLQGAYAHLGVADFWRRQRRSMWSDITPHAEYVRWRDAVRYTIEVLLASPDLTRLGHHFVRGMQTTVLGWRDDPIPQVARDIACHAADDHRRRWMHKYGT